MNLNEQRVLVVEDDAFQRPLLVRMLKPHALNVLQAADGKEALALLGDGQVEKVDLVICDLDMPNMDGLEFLRHLSELPEAPRVVINSALDEKLLTTTRQMAQLYQIPLLGVIPKPLSLQVLNGLIEQFKPSKRHAPAKHSAPTFSLEEILHGIEQDEFTPYFQPKVNLKTGQLTHAEALVRWHHPAQGVVPPGAFIPLLETHSELDALTFIMLRKSAQACLKFHALGHHLTISVNLSLTSLTAPDLAERVIQIVEESGLDPRFIMLEITESAAMTDTGTALENLARLVIHGFALSIDDYGTGYSSMQQLARIPFSELKVDQSFVRDFSDNKSLRIVVESSLDMAHKLQIKSVAEGVETLQDWQTLKAMGCDMAQGYYISPPLETGQFVQLMANFKARFAHLQQPSDPGSDRSKINILLVEDDELSRQLVRRVLTDLGYSRVSQAESAAAALKLMAAQSFDLVMTDLNMPEVSGLKLIQRIRTGKTPAKFDTRILVLTMYAQAEVLARALALDVNGFMVKPIIPSVVEKKLAEIWDDAIVFRPPLAYAAIDTQIQALNSGAANPEPGTAGAVGVNTGILRTQPVAPGKSACVTLPLGQLRPGMVVAKPVALKNDTLILPVGHRLSATNILRLQELASLLARPDVTVQMSPAPHPL